MSHPLVAVVDDHPDAREIYVAMLEHSGYAVVHGETGAAALEILRRCRPAALVMHVGLPDIDGIDLCRRIRNHPLFAALPVIGISGWGSGTRGVKLKEADFTELLLKPVPVEHLLEVVRRWAGAPGLPAMAT